jgi:uncharacterized membrane protein
LLKFHKHYFIAAILLFIIEVCIALFVNDKIVRPYIGDFLVVILIYCFVKAFFTTPVFATAIGVLLFAYLIELLQYFNIVTKLGLQHSKAAVIIIGSSFEWADLLAYTAGIIITVMIEKLSLR